MTRRELLALAPAGAALAAVTRGVRVGCLTSGWHIDPAQFPDLLAAVKAIKALGYDGFETGYRNVEGEFAKPDAARHELHRGLRFFGVNILLDSYDPKTSIAPWDLIVQVADGAEKLGAERLILSGASVGTAVSAKAAALNRAGEYCRSKGVRLAYYNQAPEFGDSAAEIKALLAATDTARVRLIIDAGHAGANVVDFLDKSPERIDAFQLPDLTTNQSDHAPLAAAIKKAKWAGWLLAEDSAEGPARNAIRSVFEV